METILALFFMHPLFENNPPQYKVNRCYSSETHIIQIKDINLLDRKYLFTIEYNKNQIFENTFNTIENVYISEVNCN